MRVWKGTGIWIRNFLLKYGPADASTMHEHYKKYCREMGYHPASSMSFRRYLNELKRKGLIRVVGTAPSKANATAGFQKYIYDVNYSMIDSKYWENPFR